IAMWCVPRPPSTPASTLSLHDALPISGHHDDALGAESLGRDDGALADSAVADDDDVGSFGYASSDSRVVTGCHYVRHREQARDRSEEHTSELQSRENLVCRLLLEKKTT